MTVVTALSFPAGKERVRGGAVVSRSEASVVAYYCPICGIPLEQSDFERPEDDYYCPFCSSQETPSQMPGLAGWEPPH
jgi:hypothetical protein